jgi:hypothetical protein
MGTPVSVEDALAGKRARPAATESPPEKEKEPIKARGVREDS